MNSIPGKVVIVGGGVIGTACAYYLRQRGCEVTIVEQAGFGSGASHANCGYISPSHVFPLAMPGAVLKTLRLMWKKNSPIYVKPRIDLRLWGWLWKFARRCNHADMLSAGAARHALLDSSRRLFDQLIDAESLACEYETRGCLFVYQHEEELNAFAKTDRLQADEFGVAARRMNRDELLAMEPAIKPNVAGAWYYDVDAHVRPDRLLAAWRTVIERMGVRVVENSRVTGFQKQGRRVGAVLTERDSLPADAFVVAAGALTPLLQRSLGCKIPIQPGKGYSITMPRPARCPQYPMIFPEIKVAVTPFQSGYRLGSTMEFSGYDTTLNVRRLEALRVGAARFLHDPYCEPVEERWYGWRPMTPDGVPLIGAAPAAENLLVAAGHNMLGLSMAPATGKLVAELLTGEKPHVDPAPYAVARK